MSNNIKDIENESDSVGSNSFYNEMVLNFISNLGYKDISSLFAEENKIKNEMVPMLERRFKIREIIEKGDINNVITELNDIQFVKLRLDIVKGSPFKPLKKILETY